MYDVHVCMSMYDMHVCVWCRVIVWVCGVYVWCACVSVCTHMQAHVCVCACGDERETSSAILREMPLVSLETTAPEQTGRLVSPGVISLQPSTEVKAQATM